MVQGMNFSRFINTRHLFFLLLLFTLRCIPVQSATNQSNYPIPFSYTTHVNPPNNLSYPCYLTPLGSEKLVVANTRNVWIFDGNYWETIPSQGNVCVTSISSHEVGISDSLGIVLLKHRENGLIDVDTILSFQKHDKIKQVTQLSRSKEGYIIFSSSNGIWELSKGLKHIDSSEHPVRIYGNHTGNFYHIENKGVFCLNNLLSTPIIESVDFKSNPIIDIFSINNQTFIIQSYYPWVSKVSNYQLKSSGNLSANFQPADFVVKKATYENGELYILTDCEGLFILDDEGNYKTRIIKTAAINLDQVSSFFVPSTSQIVALSASGIHKIQRPEYAGQFSKNINLHFSPNHCLFHNNLIFCGHRKGVSYAEISQSKKQLTFISIQGINEEIHLFKEEQGLIIAYGKNNFYSIKNQKVIKTGKVNSSEHQKNLVANTIKQQTTSKLYLEVTYGFDNNDSLFLLKRTLKDFPEHNPLWIAKQKTSGQFETTFYIGTIPSAETIKQACIINDTTIWVVTSSGLNYFKKPAATNTKPFVSVHSISYSNKKNRVFYKNGYFTKNNPLLLKGQKSPVSNVSINLSSLTCSNNELVNDRVLYSTFIEGLDTCWTSWSAHNVREVSKLKYGKYKIWVKTMNIGGEESNKTFVPLTILPRFYETKFAFVAFLILAFVGLYMVLSWRSYIHAKVRFKLESLINKRTEELVKEKEKTDNLLARVLPHDTASELKEKGKVNTQRFKMVTVLFSDIEGFTRITDETNPETLIDQLDKFFLYFDSVVEKYRIEKIKTIGDAYMCAGGIPEKNRTNPVEVILAALEMMQFMKSITSNSSKKAKVWELRIGIDTGPVIAGVVGRSKLTYDIWGSTVNTASRMESSGEVGQINISGNTYMLVKDYFICTYRGKMPVKNKGDIQMYFVNGIKPSLSEGMQGLKPNHDFFIQLQLIRLGDLEDFILEKLEKGLPKELYYHNLKHTVDVYTQVELIGRSENVSKEELLLLRTAALFHDAGHLIDYDTHEEMAVKLIREILPEYQYSQKQIDIISQLIMVTKLPPQPTNLLEEIMCDADLDYLGRPDFIPVSNMLYKELHEHGKIGTLREWNELQIKFIDKHHYFTKTARRLRNVNKQSQLDKLKRWMENN